MGAYDRRATSCDRGDAPGARDRHARAFGAGHRFCVGSLSPDDTADYLRTPLARVGATKDIFSADALAILHEAAASSLRDTDRIATAALRAAPRKKKKLIGRDVLSRILQAEAEDRS